MKKIITLSLLLNLFTSPIVLGQSFTPELGRPNTPQAGANPQFQSNDPAYTRPWENNNRTPNNYNRSMNTVPNNEAQNQPRVGPGTQSGGCLKYGAAGGLAGHVAGHGVLGAMAGCATGAWVKHKSKQRYRETGHY